MKDRGSRSGRSGRAVTLAASVILSLVMVGATAPVAEAAKLPVCPVYSKWPVKPIAPDVKAALLRYYDAPQAGADHD